MDVSENSGTPKSSILIGCSIINHPFWGTPNFWKHLYRFELLQKKGKGGPRKHFQGRSASSKGTYPSCPFL